MEEIWKDIEGYEGLYQVSNLSRVRALEKVVICSTGRKCVLKEHILIQNSSFYGYKGVDLTKNGKRKKFLIHRLVAKAFIPNPENKPEIDHINTNRSDNRIENLRWVTSSENMRNPITRAKWRESIANMSEESKQHIREGNKKRRGKGNKFSRAVTQYTLEGVFIRNWESCHWAGKELNIHSSTITRCANGKRLSAGGFKWQFLNTL